MDDVNRPTVSAEVADAIEYFRNRGGRLPAWSNEAILDNVINSASGNSKITALRTIPFDTLLAALVNGYERELSEEQRAHAKIREEYSRSKRAWLAGYDYYEGVTYGIELTLYTLGVRIEGVSA